jgi:putative phosphoesterase
LRLRVGVLSDTHLSHVTKTLKRIFDDHLAGMDMILHAGDVVSSEVIDFLARKDLRAVSGNMDPPELRQRLPVKDVFQLGPYRFGLIHGWGPSAGIEERVRGQFSDVDVIVYGHSHHAANHERDGVRYFNPGTATGFSSSGVHSMGVIEIGEGLRAEIITL